jgi:hypothetical protein
MNTREATENPSPPAFSQVRGLADATRRGQVFTFGCELGFCGLARASFTG